VPITLQLFLILGQIHEAINQQKCTYLMELTGFLPNGEAAEPVCGSAGGRRRYSIIKISTCFTAVRDKLTGMCKINHRAVHWA
jgi:hypothetical protein